MTKKIYSLILIFVVFNLSILEAKEKDHLDVHGDPIDPRRIRHQESVLESTLPDDWAKFSIPYKASYIYRMWIDGGELHAFTTNDALYAHRSHHQLFYGKISGDAVGYNFLNLLVNNLKNFTKALVDFSSITFFPDFSEISELQLSHGTNMFYGTCNLANGKIGYWYFHIEEVQKNLHMLLIISAENDALEIFDEVGPILLK